MSDDIDLDDPGRSPAADRLAGEELARAQSVRAEALESLLVEAGVLTDTEVDHYIETWNHRIGPMEGAKVVARAWVDEDFRARLLADATSALAEVGVNPGRLERLEVVANEPGVHNVVCCTLCSCYPWTILGLPPSWYKSPEYRARIVREPRRVLAEMGLDLDPDVTINVWDSSAELRYLVIPERPDGTETLGEDDLIGLISRDAMIGVAVVEPPGAL
ncbi:MAG: nitrile hydratase subunit alpha [Actinomycetota bacterium]